eukprot:Clim_evm1s111 gene=Clim_evmTU1s111
MALQRYIPEPLRPYVASFVLGETFQNAHRFGRELLRMITLNEHRVYAYLQLDDAHSYLLAQSLKEFTKRYNVSLIIRIVPAPPQWAASQPEKLHNHNRRDCDDIAPFYCLQFDDPGRQPSQEHLALATRIAVAGVKGDCQDGLDSFLEAAKAMWTGDEATLKSRTPFDVTDTEAQKTLDENAKERDNAGHYFSGMLYYAGEWYWGIDRMYFLEDRLQDLGLLKDSSNKGLHILNLKGNKTLDMVSEKPGNKKVNVSVWYSIRSPYSYLAMPDIMRWEEDARTDLEFYLVKPMVLRGLPIPAKKSIYIAMDSARRGRSIGVPFGFSCDPVVGGGIENGLKVYPYTQSLGKGIEFIWTFSKRCFAEGINFGHEKHILQIAEEMGLDTDKVNELLRGDIAEADELTARNRKKLFSDLNLWGVPSFKVNDWHTWGQDRAWLAEHKICEAIEQAWLAEHKICEAIEQAWLAEHKICEAIEQA